MKNRQIRFTSALCLMTIMLLAQTGCGGSSSSSSSSGDALAVESAAESNGLYSYSDDYEEYYEGDAVATESKTAEMSEEDAASNLSKRKLITNVSMSVETREFDSLISFLKSRTDSLGGYIESESIYNNSYSYSSSRSASFTVRVPEDKLDSFLTDISDKSNILSEDRTVTDVTLQYTDLESHKNALLAEQEQLLELMNMAESIEEILTIQSQLTDVRYQLESMESQLRTFDNQVTYSTVNMSISEVVEYTPEDPQTFGERAAAGFSENLRAVKTFFIELALAIITHIPVLILLIIIVLIIIVIVKVASKKSRQKRIKRMEEAQKMYNAGAPIAPTAYSFGTQAQQDQTFVQTPESKEQTQTGSDASPDPDNEQKQ